MKCVNCKENEAAFSANCLLVKNETHQMFHTGSATQYSVKETFHGGTKAGLCEACFKKAIRQDAEMLADGQPSSRPFTMMVGGFLLLIFGGLGALSSEEYAAYRWPVLGISLALIVIAFAMMTARKKASERKLRQTPWKVLGVRCLNSGRHTDDGMRYIPVGDGCYRGIDDFRKVNHFLSREAQDKMFYDYVENGAWKSYVKSDGSAE